MCSLAGQDRPITFMETTGPSVFAGVISTAETTTHARIILPDWVWVWYPRMAVARRAVDTFDGPGIEVCHSMERRFDKRSIDTKSWRVLCSIQCGVLLRHVSRDTSVGQFCLGSDGKAMDPAYIDTKVAWRLGDFCTNSACPYYRGSVMPYRY
jgi:hypothetical protein